MKCLFAFVVVSLAIFFAVRSDGQTTTVEIRPGEEQWAQNPALLAGAQWAVLVGAPGEAGLYAFRIKFPPDFKVMPHSHPENRIYTVINGMWSIGLGDQFDPTKLKAFPPGSVYMLPAGVNHFPLDP